MPTKKKQYNLDKIYAEYGRKLNQISKETWSEIDRELLNKNSYGTKKHRFILTVASPNLTVNQKSTIVNKLGLEPRDIERYSTAIIYTLFHQDALNFLTIKYPKIDILKDYKQVRYEFCNNDSILPFNDIIQFLIKNHPLYSPSSFCQKKLLEFMPMGANFKTYLPENKLNRAIKELSANLFTDNSLLFYQTYQAECNHIFYQQKPQLELFENLLCYQEKDLIKSGEKRVIKEFIDNLESMNLKPWAQKYFGFHSAKLLKYIKDSKFLYNGIYLMKDIQLLHNLVKDHNLIWQILPVKNSKNVDDYMSYWVRDEQFETLKIMNSYFSKEQLTVLLKEFYESRLKSSSEKDNFIRIFQDTLNMIAQGQRNQEPNKILTPLNNNYRFNDYNSWNKLHDLCSLLFTKVKYKEQSLDIPNMYPGLNELHMAPVSESLSIFVPQTNIDMINWGQQLRICVGSYWENVRQGQTLVLGLYESNKVKYCLEYDIINDSIRQLKGHSNVNACSEIKEQVRTWLSQHIQLWKAIVQHQEFGKLESLKKSHLDFKKFLNENSAVDRNGREISQQMEPILMKIENLFNPSHNLTNSDAKLIYKVDDFYNRVNDYISRFSNRDLFMEEMIIDANYRNNSLSHYYRVSAKQAFLVDICSHLEEIVLKYAD